MTTSITLQHKVVQSQGMIISDMNGETVMLSVQNGKYYNLGTIGGELWNFIGSPVIVKDMVASLMSEYDVGQTECEAHVTEFLQKLHSEGLIQVVGVAS